MDDLERRPGPWKAHGFDGHTNIVDKRGKLVCKVPGLKSEGYEREGRVCLLRVAPELREALNSIVNADQPEPENEEMQARYAAARDILKRARAQQ